MYLYEKKIPKASILHKIESVHRKKCPHFDIQKFLPKDRKPYDSESRHYFTKIEEKRISATVARKTPLQVLH